MRVGRCRHRTDRTIALQLHYSVVNRSKLQNPLKVFSAHLFNASRSKMSCRCIFSVSESFNDSVPSLPPWRCAFRCFSDLSNSAADWITCTAKMSNVWQTGRKTDAKNSFLALFVWKWVPHCAIKSFKGLEIGSKKVRRNPIWTYRMILDT